MTEPTPGSPALFAAFDPLTVPPLGQPSPLRPLHRVSAQHHLLGEAPPTCPTPEPYPRASEAPRSLPIPAWLCCRPAVLPSSSPPGRQPEKDKDHSSPPHSASPAPGTVLDTEQAGNTPLTRQELSGPLRGVRKPAVSRTGSTCLQL